MDSNRKLLKIAGILYGIFGALLLLSAPVYAIFLIITGIYIFSQASESEETIYKNRVIHFILAGIGIGNIIGSILIFIAQDNIAKNRRLANGINAPPKVIYKKDKESKKMDLLIKLGVLMIFISGLLFATTSWAFIGNSIKAILLIGLGILFLGLSLFTESKLRLYRSSYMYWLLSMSLFLLTIVGVLYFGIFGNYLTFFGNGSNLAYAITFLTGAGLALTTYYKFPKKYLVYTCCGGIIVAIAYVLAFFQFSQMMNMAILTMIIMLINILDEKTGSINIFSRILSYILFGIIIIVEPKNNIEGLFACLINIINLNYLTWIDKKKDESTINVILTYILILFGLTKFADLGNFTYCMMGITITIYSLCIMGNVIPTKSFTQKFNHCIYILFMYGFFMNSQNGTGLSNTITMIGIPITLLGINTIVKRGWLNVEPFKLANYIQPIIIFMVLIGLLSFLPYTTSAAYISAYLSIIYCIMHCLYRNSLDKKIICAYGMIAIIIGLSCEITISDVFASLMIVLSSLYILTICYLEENEVLATKTKLVVSYILLLTSVYVPFLQYNLLGLNRMIPALLFIVLIYCMAPLLRNDWIKKTSYIYAVIPLIYLIDATGMNYDLQSILTSIAELYIIILFLKFFVNNSLARNVILIIGIICCCVNPFFTQSIYTFLYIGIIGILLILYGFRKEDAYSIFITGIILTILNIIYYLKEVWKIIPIWLYLLMSGLFIIGFVTIRELKRQQKKKDKSE